MQLLSHIRKQEKKHKRLYNSNNKSTKSDYSIIQKTYVYKHFYFQTVNGICDFQAFGHCYKLIDEFMHLTQAQDACAQDDGYIVEINSAEENDLILYILEGMTMAGIYMTLPTINIGMINTV